MRYKLLLGIVFFLAAINIQAQQITYYADSSVQVAQGNGILKYPWAGGINAVFVSKMNLNNDSIEDLVLFDRTNHNTLTFLAVNKEYIHAPYYQRFFPYIDLWMHLRDYNMDGKKDIFTDGPNGVRVFKNVSNNTTIAWQLVADPLYSLVLNPGGNTSFDNMLVNNYDVISVEDVDYDGDLDIINFQFYTGSWLEYQHNMSMELYGVPDSLIFHRSTDCWGGIAEMLCNNYSFGNSCFSGLRLASTTQTEHVGAGSILTVDLNGDKLPDLLASKVTCQNLDYMQNVGSLDTALFASLDTIYPNGTLRIAFPDFPGVYHEDLDFDGVEDIIATQAQFDNELAIPPGAIDFQHSCWLYHNEGTSNDVSLSFIQKDYIQDQMIDWGENAMPAFADYDADGDLDMFVGQLTWGYNNNYSSLRLYENVGTKYIPFFELKDENYLNLQSNHYIYIKPLFTDLNGDHALDLVMLAQKNPETAALNYLPNLNSSTQPFSFNAGNQQTLLSIYPFDDPVFHDMDNDNDQDLLIGRYQGNLVYYINTGTHSTPSFTHSTDSLGGIKAIVPYANGDLSLTITDINRDGKDDLVTADNTSEITYYSDFVTSLAVNDTLIAAYINKGGSTSDDSVMLGAALRLASPDLNADGYPELVIGSNAGGLLLLRCNSSQPFKDTTIVYHPPAEASYTITIFPNPTTYFLNISSTADVQYSVIDVLGRTLIPEGHMEANTIKTITVEYLIDGLYFMRFSGSGINTIRKFIVQH